MPSLVSYYVRDRDDGLFDVVATMEPDRTYLREGCGSLAEAQEWIEGLRVLMAAIGAPVAEAAEEIRTLERLSSEAEG